MLDRLIDAVLRRPIAAALVMALVLALPTTAVPFIIDDYIHQVILDDWTGFRESSYLLFRDAADPFGLLNLFVFFQDDPERNLQAVRATEVPWWTHPEITISFWRPLTSATHLLDYLSFGRQAAFHHLHNISWYLLLVAAWGMLVRRAMPGAAGASAVALATVLYAVDDAHFMAVGWTANRNALVAAAFGLLGLIAHLRWREEGWKPGLPLSVAGFVLALLGGEAALGVFGYLGAYQLFGARGRFRDRALGLAPGLAVGLGWAVFYKAMHFGARGSGLYLDPTREPLAYASAALVRIPTLLGSQFGAFPADLWLFRPVIRPFSVSYGLICIVVAAMLLRAAWPGLSPGERRGLRWLIPGGLFSILPVIATFPLDRLLLLPSLAGSAVVAVSLRHCWRAWREGGAAWLRGLLIPIAGLHLVLSSLTWFGQAGFYGIFLQGRIQPVVDALLEQDLSERQLFLVNGSDPLLAIYLPVMLFWNGAPSMGGWVPMSMAPYDHRLTRTAEDTLELEVVDGHMLGSAFEQLLRRPESVPYTIGDTVELNIATVEILALDGVYPTRVAFTFPEALEEGPYDFLIWQGEALAPLKLPAVGETLEIPWTLGPMGL